MSESANRIREMELEIELAALRSHEKHMRYIYGLRWGGLGVAAITIIIGAIMLFMGLEGSFDWAVEAPKTVGAKMTNASPGMVFATAGLMIATVVITRKPVTYSITGGGRRGGRSTGISIGPHPLDTSIIGQ